MTTPLFANEHEMVDSIISAATDLGWMVYHHRPARTARTKMVRDRFTGQMVEKQIWETALQGDAGFPDLVLTNKRRIMFVECKMQGRLLTEGQQKWLDTLAWGGGDAFVVYPKDYDALIAQLARGE